MNHGFQFNFSRAFNYIFENPNGFNNVLFCGLCMLIPIIGPVVLYGYQMEIVQGLHVSRGRTYPDFSFDNLSDYLMRGLWVFLVTLLVSLIFVPVMWLLAILWMMVPGGVAMAGGGAASPIVFLISIPLFFAAMMAVWSAMMLVLSPMVLRAGLSLDFSSAFDFNFAKQFIGNTWKRFLLTMLIMIPFSMIAAIVGLVAFCLGVYFTMAIVNLMMANLGWQHYELHLSKGGRPVPYRKSQPQNPHPPYPGGPGPGRGY